MNWLIKMTNWFNKSLFVVLLNVISIFSYANDVVSLEQFSSLGTINGNIENQRVVVEKVLPNPVVFSTQRSQLNSSLSALYVKNAYLNKIQQGDVNINIINPLNDGTEVTANLFLGLWIDGNKKQINARQVGNDVMIEIDQSFQAIQLRSTQALKMWLPHSYRGEVSLNVEVDGSKAVTF